jgi:uncharacterized metal-binding protein (TIGR02443 family)
MRVLKSYPDKEGFVVYSKCLNRLMVVAVFEAQKRFIAGAICPRCGEMDSLVTWEDESQQVCRACVSCDFEDQLSDAPAIAPADLKTRVSEGMHEKIVLEQDEKPLTILPSPDSKT